MGWERKRGKLEELNSLLRGTDDTTFTVVTAPRELLAAVRYVITLDADTELPRDVARKLVGTIAHPLNRPQLDDRLQRVMRGYAHPAAARRHDAAQHAQLALRANHGGPAGHRPVHDRGLGRVSGPVRRGLVRRQGHLRRRRVRAR